MSQRFSIVLAEAVVDDRVSPSALRVLEALGMYVDANGQCVESLSNIARNLNFTEQALAKQIKALRDAGYVEITEMRRNDGGRAANLYTIRWGG